MDFEGDLELRLEAMRIADQDMRVVHSLAPVASDRTRADIVEYFAYWLQGDRANAPNRHEMRTVIDAQANHYVDLLAGEMNTAYVERLRGLTTKNQATGLGLRVHLGSTAYATAQLFTEIGRRHRWSGARRPRAIAQRCCVS